jgi:hypothetical protein
MIMVLGEGRPCMEAGVIDVSRRGLGLRLPAPLPAGSSIKIEAGDELILGEVAYCAPDHGAFHAGLTIKHRLEGMSDLHRLNRALHSGQHSALSRTPQDETVSLIMER